MRVIGVDLGGTKIEAIVAEVGGAHGLEEQLRRRVATESERGYEAIVERTVDFLRSVASDAELDVRDVPIGFGMPGGTTRRGGLVKNSNTTCLNGRPFRQDVEQALGRRMAFDNDANCFALAETVLGAARDHAGGVVFGVILGTGVGGGLVVRGRVWDGAQGIAGEWGHHAVWAGRPDARECYCGQAGCLERYVAGPAVEESYRLSSGERRPLVEIVARRASDPDAAAVIDDLLTTLARALANVITIVDPSAIVLGGGVSNVEALYAELPPRVAACVFNDELTTPILRHALGDSAGVIGAALLAHSSSETSASA